MRSTGSRSSGQPRLDTEGGAGIGWKISCRHLAVSGPVR